MFSKAEDNEKAPTSNLFAAAESVQTAVVETTTKAINIATDCGKQAGEAVSSGVQQAGAYVQTLKPDEKAEKVEKVETKDENEDGVIGGVKKFAAGLMK